MIASVLGLATEATIGGAAEVHPAVRSGHLTTQSSCATSYIKKRVAAYREAGVTALGITPVGPHPTNIVEKLKAWSA